MAKSKNHEDRKRIANDYTELRYVANKFNIPVWQVMKAKEELKTNIREEIYKHLQNN